PVITRKGTRRDSAIGASILTSAEKSEWIAADADEYIDIAKQLVSDPKALADIRESLPAEVEASPLLDSQAHTRALENAMKAALATTSAS
ncbi:MAG TPA: hypothetical protein VLA12_18315, partial [Planctomycetaceae bacterium]|nr:hypothetical protein [Planctomycetaceae bacterium]